MTTAVPNQTNGARAPVRTPDDRVPFGEMIALLKERVQTGAVMETLYGPSRVLGDRTIIPVGKVAYGFGVGGGAPGTDGEATGAGGGCGAGVTAKPVAVIEVSPSGTRVVPIVDVAQLATRAFLFAGCVALMGLLLGRRNAPAAGWWTARRRAGRWFRR